MALDSECGLLSLEKAPVEEPKEGRHHNDARGAMRCFNGFVCHLIAFLSFAVPKAGLTQETGSRLNELKIAVM